MAVWLFSTLLNVVILFLRLRKMQTDKLPDWLKLAALSVVFLFLEVGMPYWKTNKEEGYALLGVGWSFAMLFAIIWTGLSIDSPVESSTSGSGSSSSGGASSGDTIGSYAPVSSSPSYSSPPADAAAEGYQTAGV